MNFMSWLFDPQERRAPRAVKFILWCLVAAFAAVYVYAAIYFTSSLSEIFAFSVVVGIFSCVFAYIVFPLLILMVAYGLWYY